MRGEKKPQSFQYLLSLEIILKGWLIKLNMSGIIHYFSSD